MGIPNQNTLFILNSLLNLFHNGKCFEMCRLAGEWVQILKIRRNVVLYIFAFLVLFAFGFLFLLIDLLRFLKRKFRA